MRYFWGVVIIVLGIALLLNNLGMVKINVGQLITTYWPVIFLFWGFSLLFESLKPKNGEVKTHGSTGEIISGVILLSIGAAFLLKNTGLLDLDLSLLWKLFWPLILILAGLSFLIGKTPMGKKHVAFMGGVELGKKSGWDLKSDSFFAVMGGMELDLTKANIPEGEILLDLTVVMGGIEVKVPADLPVICEGMTVLGGIEFLGEGTGGIIAKKTMSSNVTGESKNLLRIQARAVMGGIEVQSR